VAAMCAAHDAVRALLAGSVSLTATGPRNMTALHAAIGSGSARAAQRLVCATPQRRRAAALCGGGRACGTAAGAVLARRHGAPALHRRGGRGGARERDRGAAAGAAARRRWWRRRACNREFPIAGMRRLGCRAPLELNTGRRRVVRES
jgi:hypothetical protein